MSESLSAVIFLCVTAVVVAAVLGVMAFGAEQAHSISSDGYSFFDELGKPEPLTGSKFEGSSIPMAAAAAIIRENKVQITSLNCRICNTESHGDDLGFCLSSHMQGRVFFTFIDDGEGGCSVSLTPTMPQ